MPRYAFSLAFCGRDFHGWQVQENAVTIQGIIEESLQILLKEDVRLVGCGRTDSGVHARFFVAHTDLRSELSYAERMQLVNKLNLMLPRAIVVYDCIDVPENFHARFHARSRTYKYFISLRKNPFLWDYTLYYPYQLNINIMNLAASILRRYTEFEAFCKTGGGNQTFTCHIYHAQWELYEQLRLMVFTITADRFLRNMVRAIVGTMLMVGEEKISLHQFRDIIENRNRSLAGKSVEARGLTLWDLHYETVHFNKENIAFIIQI